MHPGKLFCVTGGLPGGKGWLFQPLSWDAPCRKELMGKTGRSLKQVKSQ